MFRIIRDGRNYSYKKTRNTTGRKEVLIGGYEKKVQMPEMKNENQNLNLDEWSPRLDKHTDRISELGDMQNAEEE